VDTATRESAASELLDAYTTRSPVEPLTPRLTGMTTDDAYEIQQVQLRRRLEQGRRVVGHKVGLTSRAMQRQLGVDQPDFGYLLDDMLFLEHLPIPVGTYLQPRIEPEIGFVLGRPLTGPGVTVAEAMSAVAYVVPALEIIDSRIRDWSIGILDTIADNASSGGVVLGSTPTALGAVDLRLVGCVLHRGGELVATGAGGAVLGSPISALVWLANTVGARGVTLEAGHVVLPGSVTASVPVAPGDTFTATFGGLGSVTARFAKEES
jgi:2-keto-4-pentenoate hydratase